MSVFANPVFQPNKRGYYIGRGTHKSPDHQTSKMTLRKLTMLVMLLLQADGKPSSSCKCGIRQQQADTQISLKITGGEEAAPNEFPWAAFLQVRGGGKLFNCGGTLINDRFIFFFTVL